jgi:DNA-3-methyladenine glycosylase
LNSDSRNLLDSKFLNRPVLTVAEELLGNHICREIEGSVERHIITEVEAYDGHEDKASHANKGKTQRNAIMFRPAGNWYIYLCYGMHWLLNIVTGPEDYPAAILFRGIKDTSGPGRLTKRLQIDKSQNEKPATPQTGLWLESAAVKPQSIHIERTPRIGISYAGEYWANVPYRFILKI